MAKKTISLITLLSNLIGFGGNIQANVSIDSSVKSTRSLSKSKSSSKSRKQSSSSKSASTARARGSVTSKRKPVVRAKSAVRKSARRVVSTRSKSVGIRKTTVNRTARRVARRVVTRFKRQPMVRITRQALNNFRKIEQEHKKIQGKSRYGSSGGVSHTEVNQLKEKMRALSTDYSRLAAQKGGYGYGGGGGGSGSGGSGSGGGGVFPAGGAPKAPSIVPPPPPPPPPGGPIPKAPPPPGGFAPPPPPPPPPSMGRATILKPAKPTVLLKAQALPAIKAPKSILGVKVVGKNSTSSAGIKKAVGGMDDVIAQVESKGGLKSTVSTKTLEGGATDLLNKLIAKQGNIIDESKKLSTSFKTNISGFLYKSPDDNLLEKFKEGFLDHAIAADDVRIKAIDEIIKVETASQEIKFKAISAKVDICVLKNLCYSKKFKSALKSYVQKEYIDKLPSHYSDNDIKLIHFAIEDLFDDKDPKIQSWLDNLLANASYSQILLVSHNILKLDLAIKQKMKDIMADNIKNTKFNLKNIMDFIIQDFFDNNYKTANAADKKAIEDWMVKLALDCIKQKQTIIFYNTKINQEIGIMLSNEFKKDPKNKDLKKACIEYLNSSLITNTKDVLDNLDSTDIYSINNEAYKKEINDRISTQYGIQVKNAIDTSQKLGLMAGGKFNVDLAYAAWEKITNLNSPELTYIRLFLDEISKIDSKFLSKHSKFLFLHNLHNNKTITKFSDKPGEIFDLYETLYNLGIIDPSSTPPELLGNKLFRNLDSTEIDKIATVDIKSSCVVHLSKLINKVESITDLTSMINNLIMEYDNSKVNKQGLALFGINNITDIKFYPIYKRYKKSIVDACKKHGFSTQYIDNIEKHFASQPLLELMSEYSKNINDNMPETEEAKIEAIWSAIKNKEVDYRNDKVTGLNALSLEILGAICSSHKLATGTDRAAYLHSINSQVKLNSLLTARYALLNIITNKHNIKEFKDVASSTNIELNYSNVLSKNSMKANPNNSINKICEYANKAYPGTKYSAETIDSALLYVAEQFLEGNITEAKLKEDIGNILSTVFSNQLAMRKVRDKIFNPAIYLKYTAAETSIKLKDFTNSSLATAKKTMDNIDDATVVFPVYFNVLVSEYANILASNGSSLTMNEKYAEEWKLIEDLLQKFDLDEVATHMEWPTSANNLALDILKVFTMIKMIAEKNSLIQDANGKYLPEEEERIKFIKSMARIITTSNELPEGNLHEALNNFFTNMPDNIRQDIEAYCTLVDGKNEKNLLNDVNVKNKQGKDITLCTYLIGK